MATKTVEALPLTELFERDETAWLEIMSQFAAEGRFAEMDMPNLSEYLADMAKRDRREVARRLVTLMTHLLKWEHQDNRRSGSWRGTIVEQRRELRKLLEGSALRKLALAILEEAYNDARKQAAAETELSRDVFPEACHSKLDALLFDDEE